MRENAKFDILSYNLCKKWVSIRAGISRRVVVDELKKARGYECTAGLIFVEITGLKPSRERGAQRASRANMNEFMRADIATVEAQSTKGLKT